MSLGKRGYDAHEIQSSVFRSRFPLINLLQSIGKSLFNIRFYPYTLSFVLKDHFDCINHNLSAFFLLRYIHIYSKTDTTKVFMFITGMLPCSSLCNLYPMHSFNIVMKEFCSNLQMSEHQTYLYFLVSEHLLDVASKNIE